MIDGEKLKPGDVLESISDEDSDAPTGYVGVVDENNWVALLHGGYNPDDEFADVRNREVLDSCWGYIGDLNVLQEAKQSLEYHADEFKQAIRRVVRENARAAA